MKENFKLSESVEGRQSLYFAISIQFREELEYMYEEEDLEKLDKRLEEEVFPKLKISNEMARFQRKNGKELIYFFKTNVRKRVGEVNKLLQKFFGFDRYQTATFKKLNFYESIESYKKDKRYSPLLSNEMKNSYKGKDIQIFKDPKNWWPWQTDLWNKVFNEMNEIRPADTRKIIYLYDKEGNTGKSSFIKYWLYNFEDVSFLTYGNPQQLRSCIAKEGERKVYLIDLPRAKSEHDSEIDLLNTVEQLKNGTILNTIFGDGKRMLFDPPTVIISANYLCNFDLLSEDRWEIYKIDKATKKLIQLKEEDCQKEYKQQIIETEIQKKKIGKEIQKAIDDYFGTNQKPYLKGA